MDTPTPSATDDELELDVSFVDSGDASFIDRGTEISVAESGDCTDDGCDDTTDC